MYSDKRAQVWAKTNGHCWYCGRLMNPWEDFTIDHKDPQNQGGSDELRNLIPACKSCNSQKHAKTVEEYRIYIQQKQQYSFWGEITNTLPNTKMISERIVNDEDKEPEYLQEVENYMCSCMRIGLQQSPGYAATLMSLMLISLQNYIREPGEWAQGEWFFSIENLAAYTNQPVDAVIGHIMDMQLHNIIHICWNAGPEGGHTYKFDFVALDHHAEHVLKESRAQGTFRSLA